MANNKNVFAFVIRHEDSRDRTQKIALPQHFGGGHVVYNNESNRFHAESNSAVKTNTFGSLSINWSQAIVFDLARNPNEFEFRAEVNKMTKEATISAMESVRFDPSEFPEKASVKISLTLIKSAPGIKDDIRNLLNNDDFGDCELMCADGEVLKANRMLLAARSKVFKKLLTKGSRVNLRFGKEVVKHFLYFIHTDMIERLALATHKTALFALGYTYEIPKLQVCCERAIYQSDLSPRDCLQVMDFACGYKQDRIFAKVVKFVARNQKVLETPEWTKMVEKYPDMAKNLLRSMSNA